MKPSQEDSPHPSKPSEPLTIAPNTLQVYILSPSKNQEFFVPGKPPKVEYPASLSSLVYAPDSRHNVFRMVMIELHHNYLCLREPTKNGFMNHLDLVNASIEVRRTTKVNGKKMYMLVVSKINRYENLVVETYDTLFVWMQAISQFVVFRDYGTMFRETLLLGTGSYGRVAEVRRVDQEHIILASKRIPKNKLIRNSFEMVG